MGQELVNDRSIDLDIVIKNKISSDANCQTSSSLASSGYVLIYGDFQDLPLKAVMTYLEPVKEVRAGLGESEFTC